MKLLDQIPGDELDQLLTAYYQAEMPRPFPALKAPEPRIVPGFRWSAVRSKAALAASVGLLMVSGWLLAGRTADYAVPTLPDGGTGSGSLVRPGEPGPAVEKKNTPGFEKSR
jgi:hypothetical protein